MKAATRHTAAGRALAGTPRANCGTARRCRHSSIRRVAAHRRSGTRSAPWLLTLLAVVALVACNSGTASAPGSGASVTFPPIACEFENANGPAPGQGPPTITAPSGMTVYYDPEAGGPYLAGPASWQCSATQGGDGSGSITIQPVGAPSGDPTSVTLAYEYNGPALSDACPYFPAAAQQLDEPAACTSPAPLETSSATSTGSVQFTDPAGVSGIGTNSGYAYEADGVMLFRMAGQPASPELRIFTCVMADTAACAPIMSAFLSDGWNQP